MEGETTSTKLKQSHIHYQDGTLKNADAVGSAEKQVFKDTVIIEQEDGKMQSWSTE